MCCLSPFYTFGSLQTKSRSAAAAFIVPSFNINWQGKLLDYVSSTTAEIAAITAAFAVFQSVPYRDVVILCGFRAAIQRRILPPGTNTSTHVARERVASFALRGQRVVLQWTPAHVGIPGNHIADKLAKTST